MSARRMGYVFLGTLTAVCYLGVLPGASAVEWVQQAKLVPDDGAPDELFGLYVGLSGDTAIVGADEDDDNGSRSGSAYIYNRSGSTWTPVAKLLPADGAAFDSFGRVSISGTTAIVGATGDDDFGEQSGSAYVFRDIGSGWTQVAKLLPESGAASDWFGGSVSISGDTAIVGASGKDEFKDQLGQHSGTGAAYIFRDTGSQWTLLAKLLPDDPSRDDNFGRSVSISGQTVIAGAFQDDDIAPYCGSAYVFAESDSGWGQVAKLLPGDGAEGDRFGLSACISGNTAIVGAPYDDDNGSASGSAYVFHNGGTGWKQVAKLVPDDGAQGDFFGRSVSMSGSTAVVGANCVDHLGTNSGAAYVYEYVDSTWTQTAKLVPTDAAEKDYFAADVSIRGGTIICGALRDDDNGEDSGSAYLFGAPQSITVPQGLAVTTSVGGGSTATGGMDVVFDEVTGDGVFRGRFYRPDVQDEFDAVLGTTAADLINFALPSTPMQLWKVEFDGLFTGEAVLTLAYDDLNLSVPEELLTIRHFADGRWTTPPQVLDTDKNTIMCSLDSLSPLLISAVPEPSTLLLSILGASCLSLWRLCRRRIVV